MTANNFDIVYPTFRDPEMAQLAKWMEQEISYYCNYATNTVNRYDLAEAAQAATGFDWDECFDIALEMAGVFEDWMDAQAQAEEDDD